MLDGDEVRKLSAEGKTPTEIGRLLGAPRTSIVHHLKPKTNGEAGPTATPPKASGNGHVTQARAGPERAIQLDEAQVERILQEWWEGLPLMARLTIRLTDRRGD